MRMLLIGAPGAGKGTQAVAISERFGIAHISSGDLVPDAIVMDMLRKPVVAASESGGYVLDGFPRTDDQAKAAYETASSLGVAVEVAVFLEVPAAELTRRLLARGRGQDDRPEVIEHRLAVFEAMTRPMLDYYAQREELITVNGARPVPEVAWSIAVQLQQLRRRTQTG